MAHRTSKCTSCVCALISYRIISMRCSSSVHSFCFWFLHLLFDSRCPPKKNHLFFVRFASYCCANSMAVMLCEWNRREAILPDENLFSNVSGFIDRPFCVGCTNGATIGACLKCPKCLKTMKMKSDKFRKQENEVHLIWYFAKKRKVDLGTLRKMRKKIKIIMINGTEKGYYRLKFGYKLVEKTNSNSIAKWTPANLFYRAHWTVSLQKWWIMRWNLNWFHSNELLNEMLCTRLNKVRRCRIWITIILHRTTTIHPVQYRRRITWWSNFQFMMWYSNRWILYSFVGNSARHFFEFIQWFWFCRFFYFPEEIWTMLLKFSVHAFLYDFILSPSSNYYYHSSNWNQIDISNLFKLPVSSDK